MMQKGCEEEEEKAKEKDDDDDENDERPNKSGAKLESSRRAKFVNAAENWNSANRQRRTGSEFSFEQRRVRGVETKKEGVDRFGRTTTKKDDEDEDVMKNKESERKKEERPSRNGSNRTTRRNKILLLQSDNERDDVEAPNDVNAKIVKDEVP